MSFKYRFILAFVLLEAIFITLIVTVNYVAINDSSNKLINEKIESNIKFLDQLVKVPISIYDLATLDNLVDNSANLDYINSIIILDAQNKILSKKFEYKNDTLDEILKIKSDKSINVNDSTFEIRYKELIEEDVKLGSLYIIFDTSESSMFIKDSLKKSAFIILIEILISTFLSYIIGSRLTNMLTDLSETAKEIGENKYPDVPYQDKNDEIGVLSKSMAQMLIDLKDRRDKLKKLALELNNQKNELIEANKSKDDFLANMSHELKTPLNSINVISSVMMKNKKGKLDNEQIKNLNIINKCGNDLLYLINDVLDISKLEAGEVVLDSHTINLQNVMIEIKDMFEPQVLNKGIGFIFEVDSTIKYIFSDQNRIKQIVKNLLSNSIKFVEKGNIRFLVKDIGSNIEIIVSDDGIGISEEKLENIFDRFKQADGSTTRKYGGTGLGLAISKELAVLLGGDIFVESQVSVGTTFKVIIPKNLEKVDSKLLEEKNEVNSELMKEETKTISKDILLLNDNPILFMGIAVELNKMSNLKVVSSYDKLMALVKNEKFNYIIFDISNINLEKLKQDMDLFLTNLILICDDREKILNEFKNENISIFEKPVDKENLITFIQE